MNRSRLLRWEIFGFLFISLLGSMHHFTYEWLGRWPPLALVAPVNESTWEHLKLAFWPALVFALMEWLALRRDVRNFSVAKTAGLVLMPVVISVVFYTYTAFARSSLWPNIAIFFLAVGVGQWASCRLLTAPPLAPIWGRLALGVLAAMLVAFLSFTFFAPHIFLFADPRTGDYGILP